MRRWFALLLTCSVGVLYLQSAAYANDSDPAAISVLQQSASSVAGSNRMDDIQLKGTAQWHAGSENLQGPVVLEANSSGRSRMQLDLGPRSRTETYSGHNELPACSWSGADHVPHDMGVHNCWTIGPWFFPNLSLLPGQLQGKNLISYVGREVREGLPVEHLQIRRIIGHQPKKVTDLVNHLSTVDVYLDAETKLPAAIRYAIHPDDDALRDIPIEVRFSDYREVGGIKVPFHIEKRMNGSTLLEISIDSATFNTGALATKATNQQDLLKENQ